jgi:hypothetical protein
MLAEFGKNSRRIGSVSGQRSITQAALQIGAAQTHFQTASAFIVYAALSVLFFGMPIISHLSETYIGGGTDPICHIWAIAWWPYAIAHRINPLMAHVLWAPVGYNLVWGTDIPGPSLLIYPITRIFGPVVSYNILCLIAPPAAAATAFLLCRYACGRFWPALLGGYIFGFSPYMLCHILAHLVLILIFPVPLAVYVTLLRINAKIGRAGFVIGLIAILLFQFLSSTEIFATATIFGAIALVLGFILADKESRLKLSSVTKEIAYVYVVVTILLAPFLYYVFAPGLPTSPNPAMAYSNDLFNFVFPPPVLLVGPHVASSKVGHFFETAPWWEQAAYLGPGLWIIMSLFAWSYCRTRLGKFLVLSFALVAILSLGPVLHADGKPLVVMSWWLFSRLPLTDAALPGRFGMYLFLLAAIAAAIYLVRPSISFWSRCLLAGLSLLFIAPELSIWQRIGRTPAFLHTPGQTRIYVPDFFRSAHYKRYLARGDDVLTLPLGVSGSNEDLLWQMQSEFYFNTIDWFGAIAPPGADRWPVMAAFRSGTRTFDFSEQLDGFLGAHQVKAIIVDASASGPWPGMLSEAGMTAVADDGVLFYRVPTRVLLSFHSVTAPQMAQKQAAVSFAALVTAASRYLDGGYPLARLTPGEAQRLKLLTLPDRPISPGNNSNRWQNLWLGSRGALIGIGIVGNYQDLDFLIHDYGPHAVDIFFPFPKRLTKRRRNGDGLLLMTFTPQGLRRAASANSSERSRPMKTSGPADNTASGAP